MKALSDYSTKEIHNELVRRQGVREIEFPLENTLFISDKFGEVAKIEGPARVIINQD